MRYAMLIVTPAENAALVVVLDHEDASVDIWLGRRVVSCSRSRTRTRDRSRLRRLLKAPRSSQCRRRANPSDRQTSGDEKSATEPLVKSSELVRGQRGRRPLWLDRDSGDIAARVGEVAKTDRQARAPYARETLRAALASAGPCFALRAPRCRRPLGGRVSLPPSPGPRTALN
jgi:hypothetical protein